MVADAQSHGADKNGKALPTGAVDRLSGDTKVGTSISTDDQGSGDEASDSGYDQAGWYEYGLGSGSTGLSGLAKGKTGPGGAGTYDPATGVTSSPLPGDGKTFRPRPIDPILRGGEPVPVTKTSVTEVTEPTLLVLLAPGFAMLGLLLVKRASTLRT
ncbi:MAG TPA: hypothetical protein VKF79_09850 [Candidatus Acidoferrum sp.]|nr:hypothetical protein [Candidatus Acidoferrum sp.]